MYIYILTIEYIYIYIYMYICGYVNKLFNVYIHELFLEKELNIHIHAGNEHEVVAMAQRGWTGVPTCRRLSVPKCCCMHDWISFGVGLRPGQNETCCKRTWTLRLWTLCVHGRGVASGMSLNLCSLLCCSGWEPLQISMDAEARDGP